MTRSTFPVRTVLSHHRLIGGGLLALGLILGSSTPVRAQATATVSSSQTVPASSFAATIENFSGATASGTGTYTTAGSMLNGNANFSGLGTASFTAGGSNAALPTGGSGNFLAVGNASGQSTSVTVGFTGVHYFGLLWGSADNSALIGGTGLFTPANTVTLNFSNGTNGVYTSNTLGLASGSTNYVNFVTNSNAYTITSAVLSYTSSSFEIDNLAYSAAPVPEPATWYGGGVLLGVAAWGLRRVKSSRVLD